MSFDPERSYSKTFSYEENADPIATAHVHAAKFLPKGTKYEIRSFDRRRDYRTLGLPENSKNDHRAGWYYVPEGKDKELDDALATPTMSDGGTDGTFQGRFIVP